MKKPRLRPDTPFTRILNSIMKERAISVRKAAKMAGVGISTVMSWKSGAMPENYIAVKRFAEGLGTTLSFLLTGEDDTRQPGALPAIAEVFDDAGLIFDGYAKITVQRLVPKTKNKE
ncbi:MAG: hypothetical protein AABZ06_09620 [Bdellovibrionota bacterium]